MNWKRFIPFLRPKGVPGKPLLDREYIENSIESSPVPIVLTIVMIWMVSAVLLLLSENRQRDLTVWADGQKAPFSVWARADFTYEDTRETEIARQKAREIEPEIYRIDQNMLNGIKLEFIRFFSAMQNKENALADQKSFPRITITVRCLPLPLSITSLSSMPTRIIRMNSTASSPPCSGTVFPVRI